MTLRDYVRQLRTLTHTSPGQIGRDGQPQICRGIVFGENEYGPFEDMAAFSAFFNNKYEITKRYRPRQVAQVSKPFDDRGPLVYTHQDLHMQNIILGDDGQLWIIDWDLAGFYPIFFEYIGIRTMTKVQPPSFNRWIPLITGRWDGRVQYDFVCRVGWAMMMKGMQL